MQLNPLYKQDLHIHTVFSAGDSAVVKEQTIELVSKVNHAVIIGISDHFESVAGENFTTYAKEVRSHNFKLGTEIDGHRRVDEAIEYPFDYFIIHCWDQAKDYKATSKLLLTGKPVIIAHPNAIGTNLYNVPEECLIEINNRYVYRYEWKNYFTNFKTKFRFVLSSDAHQPNWLNQNVSRYVANELGIEETILF